MKMHKNCCSFWLRYAPDTTGAALPQGPDLLDSLEGGPPGKGKEGGEGKRRER